MKVRIPEILLGALLAIAIFAMGMTLGSPSSQPTNPQHHTEPRDRPEPFSLGWYWHDAAGFFTALLFIVGGIQAGLFVWQLSLIRKSLDPAEKAAKAAVSAAEYAPRVERAYVFIEPIFGGPGASRVKIDYTFYNHGKTPAVVKSLEARTQVSETEPDNSIHNPNRTIRDEYVLPASDHWGPMHEDCAYSDDERKALMERGKFIWLYGSLVYTDVFGIERVTRFRWKLKDFIKGRFHADGGKPYNERI